MECARSNIVSLGTLEPDVSKMAEAINEHSFASSGLEAISADEALTVKVTGNDVFLPMDVPTELPCLCLNIPRDHDLKMHVADVGHSIAFFVEGHLDRGLSPIMLSEVGVNNVELWRAILDQDLGHNGLL